MSCEDFVAAASDTVCLRELLSVLPDSARSGLSGALQVIRVVVQAENFLAAEADALLDWASDQVDEAIAGPLHALDPLFAVVDDVAPFLAPFAQCPSTAQIFSAAVAPAIQVTGMIRSDTWRKRKIREASEAGVSFVTSTIASALQSEFVPDGVTSAVENALEHFDDLQDCIGSSGLPTVQ